MCLQEASYEKIIMMIKTRLPRHAKWTISAQEEIETSVWTFKTLVA